MHGTAILASAAVTDALTIPLRLSPGISLRLRLLPKPRALMISDPFYACAACKTSCGESTYPPYQTPSFCATAAPCPDRRRTSRASVQSTASQPVSPGTIKRQSMLQGMNRRIKIYHPMMWMVMHDFILVIDNMLNPLVSFAYRVSSFRSTQLCYTPAIQLRQNNKLCHSTASDGRVENVKNQTACFTRSRSSARLALLKRSSVPTR